MNIFRKQVEALVEKAGTSHDSNDALKFSQAAANAANAMVALVAAETNQKQGQKSQ